ncbi:T9SS-dependent choice-of-anchor J family protein [Flavobacterium sp. N1994]|uniref:T9SS-dependent choice-of-anchor J family protein n=1 Tax=Flavobacterium sp. N1994 TaxID=2986827 RepID=UPI00222369B4|nr:choice-of-anchor J domain-containing protein [Flavobacterium sp. N1994]
MKKFTFLISLCLCSVFYCNAQFSENFDGGVGSALPTGWTKINGANTASWLIGSPLYITAHSGTKVAMISGSGSAAHDDYLITPQITVVAGVTDRLSYWVGISSTGNLESYDVKISKTGTALANFTDYAHQNVYGPQFFTKRTINLSAYVGQSIYVAFHATSPANSIGLNLDDVVNDGFPTCSATTGFSESFELTQTVNSSVGDFPGCWTSQNAANQNNLWYIGYSDTGAAHTGQYVATVTYNPATCLSNYLISPKITVTAGVNDRFSFWARSGATSNRYLKVKVSTTTPTVGGFTSTLVNAIGLTTTYKQVTLDLSAYVGQSIYLGVNSEDATSGYFLLDDVVNDALPVVADFPQGFESANTIPGHWRALTPSNTSSWSVSANGHTGVNAAQYDYSSAAQNDMLVTPAITVVAGVNDRLSFWAKSTTGFYNQNNIISVATVANPTAANFNPIKYCDSFSTWSKQFVDLSAYVGQTIYLSFKGTTSLTSSAVSFYYDDFVLDRLVPALHSDCQGVYNFTLQNTLLLNGQNASQNTITFYYNEPDAIAGTNAIANPESAAIYSSSPITIYARIYNNTTNTFTTNYFGLVSDKIDFQFQVNNGTILASLIGGSSVTLQWYYQNTALPNETSPFLNTQFYPQFQAFSLKATNTVTGCTITSNPILIPVFGEDTFTLTLTSEAVTTTSSVFDNDILFGLALGTPAPTDDPTFTMNVDGTINVAAGTPPGTYSVIYSYSSVGSNVYYYGTRTATVLILSSGIRMNAFLDSNNNGVKDSGEQNFTKGQFHYILNDNGIENNIFSSIGSCTIYDNVITNSYDLSYTINNEFAPYYALANPTFNNVVINGNGFQTFNFPITATQTYADLSVTISPLSQPRPGFTYINRLTYTNNGNQTLAAGTVTFSPNIGLFINAISQSGTTSTANGFSYAFTNLNPSESRYIDVTINVPSIPSVTLGQLLTSTATITNPTGEIYPTDNSASLTQAVIGSYDPNNKSESHGGRILQSSFSANDYLTYTILFENTGTADAITVQVNDVLDAKLDETSIRMLGASHNYILDRVGSTLNWKFSGINLPPSVANSQIGHGYIVFKVKPKAGYALGDIIPNTANIYFDFNPAIVTNTFTTQFVATLGTEDFAFAYFSCYPNPVKNTLTVTNDATIDTIEIATVLGQSISSQKVNDLQTQINLSGLASGIYFVKVTSSKQEKTIKIIKD